MNNLKGLRCYLSGPIEYCENAGTKWRDEITPQLKEMGVIVYDPTKMFAPDRISDVERLKQIQEAKANEDWDTVAKLARPVRNFDLRLVDKSDFLIAFIDPDIQMCGTWHEVFKANEQKKPILLVWKGGKPRVSGWMYGTLPHKYFFETFKDAVQHLEDLDCGDEEFDNRWVIVDE